jgi:hypothetical protein
MKDILEIITEYGLEVVKEGEILRALCPFHNDSGRPNFTVYKDTDSWFCFACNFGGDAIDFVSKFEGISKRQAMSKLRGNVDEFAEFMEMADGLDVPDESVKNNECDFSVSYMVRQAMQQYPNRIPEVFKFLKEFDVRLQEPITLEQEQEILNEVKQKLLNSVIIE